MISPIFGPKNALDDLLDGKLNINVSFKLTEVPMIVPEK